MGLLEYSAQLFHEAKMFEAMIEVYKLVLPIHESRRNFDKLEKITDKMHSGYQKIVSRGNDVIRYCTPVSYTHLTLPTIYSV